MNHFNINQEGRDFFVGDIHGMYDLFMDSIRGVDFDFECDRVFSVGDLIDRGPDSPKCMGLLKRPWFHAVRGNHEDLLMGLHGWNTWMMNGGDWINSCEEKDLNHYKKLIERMMSFTLTVDTSLGKVGVVHAESTDDWENNDADTRELNTWARYRIKFDKETAIANIDRVVVGHTPLKEVVRFTNHVYIDTGACFPDSGGYLTLLSVEEVFAE